MTAALPYANGGVHIGHLAGVYVPADIYVRYLRLKKRDVVFIGGSDEHGVPVTIRARKGNYRYRRWLIAITTSSRRVSRTSVSLLIFTAVPLRQLTISLLQTSSAHSMTRAYWKKR